VEHLEKRSFKSLFQVEGELNTNHIRRLILRNYKLAARINKIAAIAAIVVWIDSSHARTFSPNVLFTLFLSFSVNVYPAASAAFHIS